MAIHPYPALASDDDFEIIHKFTASWEKDRDPNGITNIKADHGGATRNGVCIEFLKDLPKEIADLNHDGKVDVKDIWLCTPDVAKRIFKYAMWDNGKSYCCPPMTSMAFYDFAVNSGPGRATQKVQQAMDDLWPGTFGKYDMSLGPKTRAALAKHSSPADDEKLAYALCDRREKFFRSIAKGNQVIFLKGWLNRLNALRKFLKELNYYKSK